MSEGIIKVLEKTLEGADDDRQRVLDELEKIRVNSEELRDIIYAPYLGNNGDKIPGEFRDPDQFLDLWDKTDRALGNTILMVMPPSVFQPSLNMPENKKTEDEKNQPIVIQTGDKKEDLPHHMPVRGFLSGFHDVSIAKLQLEAKQRRDERPTITTEKVTYDPKDIVYQLIPSLNQIKELYFKYLRRHQSNKDPSIYLLKLGHMRLQEEMSKYFNVVYPFCYASITFQTEKIRRDKLVQTAHFSKIAQAEAEARAYQMPFIPPEIRAFTKAMREGRPYHPEGMKMPTSNEIAKRVRKNRE